MRASDERVLFVFAHPDDESLFTGGAIAQTVAGGSKVTVVTCTRGELGGAMPDDLAPARDHPEAIAEIREQELRSALVALGVTDHRFLGSALARRTGLVPREYWDSGMTWSPSGGAEPLFTLDTRSLCAAPLEEIVDDLRAVVASTAPDSIVSYGPTGVYGHPDQLRVYEAVHNVAVDLDIPFFHLDVDSPSRSTLELDVSDVFEAKRTAIAAHRSQIAVDDDRYTMVGGQTGRIPRVERYRILRRASVESRPSWPEPGGSLGRFILGSVLSLIAGLTVGTLATLVHQSTWTIGGFTIPIGLILGGSALAALLAGLRLVSTTRAFAGLAGVAALAAAFVLTNVSRGGSVLVPGNATGVLWTVLLAIIVAVAIAWPKPGTLSALRSRPRSAVPPANGSGILEPSAEKGRRRS